MSLPSKKKIRAWSRPSALLALAALLAAAPIPEAWSCACGCGVYDTQTNSMLPTQPGGMLYLEYDFMNQKQNWAGTSSASNDNNNDKQIRSNFINAGAHYMFNRQWGVMINVPVDQRYFKTMADDGGIQGYSHTALGDISVQGVYTGFSPDMSSGLTFGLKLPTGDDTYANFDRDTELGTGSTQILLGGYHTGAITADNKWMYFADGEWDEPTLIAAGYRPGAEVDAIAGGYYNDWHLGDLKLAPLAQVVGSLRWRDSGPAADSADTGYQRIMLWPGLELDSPTWKIDAGAGFPVYQHANGNQLVANEYYRLIVGWSF